MANTTLSLTAPLNVRRYVGNGKFAGVRLARGTQVEITMEPGALYWGVHVAGRKYTAGPAAVMTATR